MTFLAQRDQQERLEWLDGGVLSLLLDGAATDGQLMVGRFAVRRGEAPPYHVHTREDEVFLLIEGTALLWSDGRRSELSAGGVAFLPRGVPHGYRITSPTADLLMICTPSGIEGMFREVGRDVSAPRPPGWRVDLDRLAEAAAERGNTILGPPR